MDFSGTMMIYLGLATVAIAISLSIKNGCKEIADAIRAKGEPVSK